MRSKFTFLITIQLLGCFKRIWVPYFEVHMSKPYNRPPTEITTATRRSLPSLISS